MTTVTAEHIQFDRAFFQSKVIQANFQRLGVLLSAADAGLRDDLASATVRFDEYVSNLNHACLIAARVARSTELHRE